MTARNEDVQTCSLRQGNGELDRPVVVQTRTQYTPFDTCGDTNICLGGYCSDRRSSSVEIVVPNNVTGHGDGGQTTTDECPRRNRKVVGLHMWPICGPHASARYLADHPQTRERRSRVEDHSRREVLIENGVLQLPRLKRGS